MISTDWQPNEYGTWRASVSTTSTSDAVMINHNAVKTSVALYPEGTAKVVYTVGSPSEVTADTAEWIDWPLGEVTSNAADGIITVVTAVKAVSVSGDSVTMEVVSR